MKKTIITAILMLFVALAFVACGKNTQTAEPTKKAEDKLKTTVVSTVEETSTEISTAVSEKMSAVAETSTVTETNGTTKAPTTVSVPADGNVHKEKIEVEEVRYGVWAHFYKVNSYKINNGNKVVVGTEYTNVAIVRDLYSADYDELLPAARKNRETYRDYINEVLRIVNGYRAAEGIAPLTLNEDLTIMSCVRAEEIAWSGNHNHTRPGYKSFKTLFKEAGYDSGLAGENLGWGYATPEAVCEAWKNSKSHYKNIMDPRFTQIGIGVAADADPRAKLCWTQHFYEG